MTNTNECLADGEYPCQATLHIKNGRAVVVLHSCFGLAAGASIPRLRDEPTLAIEPSASDTTKRLGLFNGHGII